MTIEFNNSTNQLVLLGKTAGDKAKLQSLIASMDLKDVYYERDPSLNAIILKIPMLPIMTVEGLKIAFT